MKLDIAFGSLLPGWSPAAKARRSMPAQNARSPVPVSTTARISGSFSASPHRLTDAADDRRGQRVARLRPVEPGDQDVALSLAYEFAVLLLRSSLVSRRLGELCRTLHQLGHDRPEGLQLYVVAGPLEALLEHDSELPLGEDHVVVDVVDLPAGHLGVVREI